MNGQDGRQNFDRVVAEYARTRPGYPDAILELFETGADVHAGSRVLDLGAGTGKLTRSLAARGYDVVAVEPLPGMRAQLTADLPRIPVLAGGAERIPLPDASADAVCVAQAFHWFEPQPALAEIARVLRPGGSLALLWNLWDLDDPASAALEAIVAPLETGRIRHLTTGNHPYGGWAHALAADARFTHVLTRRDPHRVELDAVGAGERVASMSQVQSAPAAEREAAIEAATALVAGMAGGRASFGYQTEIEIRRRCSLPTPRSPRSSDEAARDHPVV